MLLVTRKSASLVDEQCYGCIQTSQPAVCFLNCDRILSCHPDNPNSLWFVGNSDLFLAHDPWMVSLSPLHAGMSAAVYCKEMKILFLLYSWDSLPEAGLRTMRDALHLDITTNRGKNKSEFLNQDLTTVKNPCLFPSKTSIFYWAFWMTSQKAAVQIHCSLL